MVRKIISTMILCGVLIGIAGAPAHAENSTSVEMIDNSVSVLSIEESLELYALTQEAYQGTISTTYITFFRDIVAGLPVLDDYVFLRTGDNEYTMYSGDLDYTNGTFYMTGEGKEYVIEQVSGSGYGNSYYRYSVSTVDDVRVNVGSFLVYSNLGDFPQFEDRGVLYEYATFMAVFVIGLCALVRPLSNFVLRFRNGN